MTIFLKVKVSFTKENIEGLVIEPDKIKKLLGKLKRMKSTRSGKKKIKNKLTENMKISLLLSRF